MSDQLMAYEISDPEAKKAALCVLLGTKEPKIQWFPTRHDPEDFDIGPGLMHKWPGRPGDMEKNSVLDRTKEDRRNSRATLDDSPPVSRTT